MNIDSIKRACQKPLAKKIIDRLYLAVVAYVAVLAILYGAQDALIFHPRSSDEWVSNDLSKRPGVERLHVRTADGIELTGWFRHAAGTGAAPVVLYFGGNAEDITDTVSSWNFDGISLAVLEYRGYGESGGEPSEKALYADSLAFYDTIAKRSDVDVARMSTLGWSLGTGVAAYVASERQVYRLALIDPYDSIAAVAQEVYPIIPVSLLLRHRFDTLALVPKITAPTYIIASEKDRVIPHEHAENLAKSWKSPLEFYLVPGGVHDESFYPPETFSRLQKFFGVVSGRERHETVSLGKK